MGQRRVQQTTKPRNTPLPQRRVQQPIGEDRGVFSNQKGGAEACSATDWGWAEAYSATNKSGAEANTETNKGGAKAYSATN